MQLIALITSFVATGLALYLLYPIAIRAGLVDKPGGRKQHEGAVPLIGGLAVFTGTSLAVLLTQPLEVTVTTWLLCGLGVVVLGVADDAEDLSVKLRIVVQVLLAFGLCVGTGLHLENLGNLLGLGEVHLGMAGYLFTALAVVGAINCFNMIDGMDGLLGSVSLTAFGSLAILFHLGDKQTEWLVSTLFLVALLPYLMNNLQVKPFKQKIFMGDAGSMLIGLTLLWLMMAGTQQNTVAFRPVTALWLIAIPLMDMVRVTLQRLRNRTSPFQAGRDHLHHILQDAGFSHRQALIIIAVPAVTLALVGLLTEQQHTPEAAVFVAFLLVFLVYMLGVNYLSKAGTHYLQHPWLQRFLSLTGRNNASARF